MSNNWFLRTTGGANTWAVREGTTVSPSAGTVQIIGQQATVSSGGAASVLPSTATVRLVGQDPTVPGQGAIDGGGTIITVVEAYQTLFWDVRGTVIQTRDLVWQIVLSVSPTVATVRLAGQTPTLKPGWERVPLAGTLRLVGQTPTLNSSWSITPTGASVRLTGQTPLLQSPWQASPSVATLRLVGQDPTVDQTWSANPTVGTLRLVGQQSTLEPHVVSPTVATLRIVAQGRLEREQALVWTVFESYVEQTYRIFWQRAATVTTTSALEWIIFSPITRIRMRAVPRSMALDVMPKTVELRSSRKTITLRAA